MKKLLIALAALTLTTPALADPAVRGWKTNDSLGCMMMRECTDEVIEIKSTEDLDAYFPYANFDLVRTETDGLIAELNKMGVRVYLGNEKYFVSRQAGVYYTVGNDLFLNDSYADDPYQMLQTLRHEGYHAAQDAMAGTIDNNSLAIIYPEEEVPSEYIMAAEIAYPENVRPWEQEAKWAGGTMGMTLEVLRIINDTDGKPWTVIEPTPLTRLWLERNGYM